MYKLKAPLPIPRNNEGQADWLETKGEYRTLDEAIDAAIKTDLDLSVAVIEKHGGMHPVNEWIMLKIAGATLKG